MVDICTCVYHFVHMLHSPAVQLGRSQGHFLPSQVQTAPLHQSTQSTVSLTQPPVTASTNLTPPVMTTPPEPHMVAHTSMSVATKLLTTPVVLFPVASLAPPTFPLQYSEQVMRSWVGTRNKAMTKRSHLGVSCPDPTVVSAIEP